MKLTPRQKRAEQRRKAVNEENLKNLPKRDLDAEYRDQYIEAVAEMEWVDRQPEVVRLYIKEHGELPPW
jgi:hypothetical protein